MEAVGGIYEQVIIAVVVGLLAYVTGSRVRNQDSGWAQLVKAAGSHISNLQKSLSAALAQNVELQQALREARAEALVCPYPHPHTEQVDVTGPLPRGHWGE